MFLLNDTFFNISSFLVKVLVLLLTKFCYIAKLNALLFSRNGMGLWSGGGVTKCVAVFDLGGRPGQNIDKFCYVINV